LNGLSILDLDSQSIKIQFAMRIALFSFLMMTIVSAFAQAPNQKFIEVLGLGEKEIIADYIEMSVSVQETDNLKKDGNFAQKEKMVLDAIRNLGVAQDDITIDDFNAYRFGLSNSSNRYSLSKTYLIKVQELKSIDQFFIKLYEAGAGKVDVIKRVKTDLEKYKTEAVKIAVENAKQRAKEIATSLEVNLGKAIQVIEVREGETNPNLAMDRYFSRINERQISAMGAVHRGYAEPEMETLPNVDIRKMKIIYKVLIQFEILN
jgi:uncharacterized protein